MSEQSAENGLLTHYLAPQGAMLHAVASGFGALNASRDVTKVDCATCLGILGYNENRVAMCACKRYGPPHVWEPGESCAPTRVIPSAKSQLGVEADATDQPTVCIAHGNFIPCRKDGEHRHTTNPYWVKSVRDYQTSPIDDLTWEPAWLATDAAAYEWPENFGREEWWAE